MNKVIFNIILALILILSQGLFFNNINFLGSINPFVYIFFIAYFPLKNNRIFFIFCAFIFGLMIDFFSDTHAIHAAASLTIAYLRPYFLKLYFGMAYEHQVVKFNSIELKQNLFYLLSIILIHHLILFSMEIFDISKISLVIKNTFNTAIFTFITVYILFELIINRAK
tara:strand:+ start:2055 stop:2558 length:504 start_codon:yes stop_codon:yes gene_type:complete